MDRRVLWATIHGITKSRTQLKRLSTCSCMLSRIQNILFQRHRSAVVFRAALDIPVGSPLIALTL